MVNLMLEFLYRLIVTILVLVPSLTAIVVACTIIYDKDFRKNKVPTKEDKKENTQEENSEHLP